MKKNNDSELKKTIEFIKTDPASVLADSTFDGLDREKVIKWMHNIMMIRGVSQHAIESCSLPPAKPSKALLEG